MIEGSATVGRAVGFALSLALAAASVTYGVSLWSDAAAFIVGGALLAGWSALVFVEAGK